MEVQLTSAARRVSGPFLRISLAIILAWIGTLKFVDPSPVVGLLQASLPFLAFNAFVYLVGAIEIIVAVLMITGVALPYAGLVTVGLFAGTLTIFAIAPVCHGLPCPLAGGPVPAEGSRPDGRRGQRDRHGASPPGCPNDAPVHPSQSALRRSVS